MESMVEIPHTGTFEMSLGSGLGEVKARQVVQASILFDA